MYGHKYLKHSALPAQRCVIRGETDPNALRPLGDPEVSGTDRPPGSSRSPDPSRPPKKCPICGKPTLKEHDPFCSKRCAQVDLNRWLSGTYAIPGRKLEEEDEAGD